MAVRIRLSRFGRTHRPYFRIVVMDSRVHREGKANEIIGLYDPTLAEKNVQVDMDRVQAWMAKGALLTPSLRSLLKFSGYKVPTAPAKPRGSAVKKAAGKKTAKPTATKKGVFIPASRRAVRQHQAKLKGERKVVTAAAVAAAAAAKAAAKPAEGAEAPKT